MQRVGDGDMAHGIRFQSAHLEAGDIKRRARLRPHHDAAESVDEQRIGVGEALFDEAAGIVDIGGEEEIEGAWLWICE